RDNLLGLPIHDVDIATSAYPAEIKQIFKRTVDTGIQHGTVMILDHGNGYEVTTFRTETGYQDFRRPDSVTFVRSLEEDLKRRDFTINALAMRADGEIIDLFDGIADLKAHKIRAVGVADERFHEDALRMMRAVRFESQL
ncbi:CCA tRNA nucleotidyltransferase, partial [Klebsiella pneumoniae]|nr:CCA tRNA nucleotidyltransferase [Klebsiella pneumoniae]